MPSAAVREVVGDERVHDAGRLPEELARVACCAIAVLGESTTWSSAMLLSVTSEPGFSPTQ